MEVVVGDERGDAHLFDVGGSGFDGTGAGFFVLLILELLEVDDLGHRRGGFVGDDDQIETNSLGFLERLLGI